jgi:hypothetical protein
MSYPDLPECALLSGSRARLPTITFTGCTVMVGARALCHILLKATQLGQFQMFTFTLRLVSGRLPDR